AFIVCGAVGGLEVGELTEGLDRYGFDLTHAALPFEHEIVQNKAEKVGPERRPPLVRPHPAKDPPPLECEDVKIPRLVRRNPVNPHRITINELTVLGLEVLGGLQIPRQTPADQPTSLPSLAQRIQTALRRGRMPANRIALPFASGRVMRGCMILLRGRLEIPALKGFRIAGSHAKGPGDCRVRLSNPLPGFTS